MILDERWLSDEAGGLYHLPSLRDEGKVYAISPEEAQNTAILSIVFSNNKIVKVPCQALYVLCVNSRVSCILFYKLTPWRHIVSH